MRGVQLTAVALIERIGLVGLIGEVVERGVLGQEVILGKEAGDLGLVGVEVAKQHLQVQRVDKLIPSVDVTAENHVGRSGQIEDFVVGDRLRIHAAEFLAEADDDFLHVLARVKVRGLGLREITFRIGDLVVQGSHQVQGIGKHSLGLEDVVGGMAVFLGQLDDFLGARQDSGVEIGPGTRERGVRHVVGHHGVVLVGRAALNDVLGPEGTVQGQFITNLVGSHQLNRREKHGHARFTDIVGIGIDIQPFVAARHQESGAKGKDCNEFFHIKSSFSD